MRPALLTVHPASRVSPSGWTRFLTPIGWIGIGWTDEGLAAVRMGYHSEADLISRIGIHRPSTVPTWVQRLEDRLQAYCSGTKDDFSDVPVATLWSTEFQRAVVASLRNVAYGQTTTYGELATRAGRPGAARAVGQVMATNPVALVVPCHRVLASGGRLGGFSAPTGGDLKRQLLDMEAASFISAAASPTATQRRSTTAKQVR